MSDVVSSESVLHEIETEAGPEVGLMLSAPALTDPIELNDWVFENVGRLIVMNMIREWLPDQLKRTFVVGEKLLSGFDAEISPLQRKADELNAGITKLNAELDKLQRANVVITNGRADLQPDTPKITQTKTELQEKVKSNIWVNRRLGDLRAERRAVDHKLNMWREYLTEIL